MRCADRLALVIQVMRLNHGKLLAPGSKLSGTGNHWAMFHAHDSITSIYSRPARQPAYLCGPQTSKQLWRSASVYTWGRGI